MKVLHFRSTSTLAGPERYILELVRPLREEGFEMQLVAYYRRKDASPFVHPMLDEASKRALEIEQWEDMAWLSPSVIRRLARKLKMGGFSLLHTHDYKTNVLGGIAARLAGVNPIATLHLHDLSTRRLRLYRILDLVVLRSFPRVIAVAEALRRELIAAGLPPSKVVTIHNGIEGQGFAAGAFTRAERLRQQLGIGTDQPVISTIGRLSPQKGQRDFLESAARVLKAVPNAMFLVLGDGPAKEELRDLCRSLNIQDAVSFLGHQRDVAAFMAMSDAIVLASVREGLPYVLLEALTLARPVVATQVGGVPELVQDGETGLLVPPHRPDRLAEAILYLLRNPAEATRLGQKGQERVLREFTAEAMARKTAKVYQEVLSESL